MADDQVNSIIRSLCNEFFSIRDLAHEVILNGKLRISSVYLQCNKSKLTKKKPRYSWPVSTGRTGQRIFFFFFFFLHLVCSLSGVLYFELSPRKLISLFSLVQTVAALLLKLLGLFAHSLKFDRFQTLRSNSQQYATRCNRVSKRTQHITSNNVGSCCQLAYNSASLCT